MFFNHSNNIKEMKQTNFLKLHKSGIRQQSNNKKSFHNMVAVTFRFRCHLADHYMCPLVPRMV